MHLREKVGVRVRGFRTAARLSQEDLADMIDVTHQTIGQIERGKVAPSFDVLEALSSALKIAPAAFFPEFLGQTRATAKERATADLMGAVHELPLEDLSVLLFVANALRERPARKGRARK